MEISIRIEGCLLKQACQVTGIQSPQELVQQMLIKLVQIDACKQLAALGGTDITASAGRRR